jgi:glutamate/tyrosine decarboxylase-like PLP-dependent enzyme
VTFPFPHNAFVDPTGENRAAVASLLQQVVEQIVSHLTGAADHPPLPDLPQLNEIALSETPATDSELLGMVQQVMTQSMNPAHPRCLGHMDPMPATASMIGDWVVAALNNNMLSVEMSPIFSQLEPLLMTEIARLFGLGDRAGGLLVSGGSLANLQALAMARNTRLACAQVGLAGLAKRPVFFVSAVAHTSIKKAAMLLGLGQEAAIAIPTNAYSQMDVTALEAALDVAYQAGHHPFALVGTAGTTVTGNIDPLPTLAAIAQAHNLWFHVDAAYGGALIFSNTHRDRLRGIEEADSVTFNPQKWMYVSKTCASVLFRDFSLLRQHFQVAAPYMNQGDQWVNLGELTVQGTRHVDVLKLWLSLQHLGKQGYRELIDNSYGLTEEFVQAIRDRPYLQLASEPEMNLVCFRGTPDTVSPDRWDEWNAALQRYLLKEYHAFISLPTYQGHAWLKAVLLNPYTTSEDIQAIFAGCDRFLAQATSF